MKKFLSVFVALLLVIAIIPASSLATTQYGYVTGGWLRLRSSASFSSSTIASYNTGTRVEILGTSGSWYHVKMDDGTTGYMYSSYISLTSPGTGTGTAYVTSTNGYGVRMRTGPGTSYSIIGVYSVGTAVTVLETGTNWCKIQIGSHTGYMMKKFLTTSGGGTTGDTATIWSPNGYGVRLRTGAGTGYSIIGVYSVGTTVTILTHGTTWDYISVGSRTGYMMNYYLTSYSTAVATGITVTPASATAAQGATVALTTAVTGTSLSNPAYTLAVTQNATMASISGNNLVISGTATVGTVIQVTATTVNNNSSGNKITATCTVTVTAGTPVASGISISPASVSVKQGNSVALTTTVTGSSLSSPAYALSITQNASMASLSGDTLTVSGSATVGSVIKVTALSTDNNSTGNKLAAICEITVIASTAPGAPTLSNASAGNTQVTLTWTAPSDNGGVALSGYKVYYGTTNVIGAASSTSLLGGSLTGTTITGLTNGTPYYFWVAAVNSVGEGGPSASNTATPTATVTVPGAPTLTSATAGNTQVTLVWAAPADIGSSALTGYKFYVNTVNTFATATGTSVFGGSLTGTTVTGLSNGTTYYFWVAAVNGTGEGAASTSLNAIPSSPPTDITLSSNTVAENTASGTAVGTLATVDSDTGDTFTYTLVSGTGDTDNASFTIDSSSLKLAVSPDYETKSSYSVRVRVTDSYSNTYEEAFTITVTNVNETPTALALSASSVAENTASGSTVGTFSTADPDAGDTFTYALTAGTGDTDNTSFTIDGSALKLSFSPNYETKSSYSVRVTVTDSATHTFSQAFTISISNVNEAPTAITVSPDPVTVAENSAIGTEIGTFTTTDVDTGDTFTYSLVSGTGDTDNASFTIDADKLKLAVSPDYETKTSYNIRVRSTDSGSASVEQTFTVTITDVAD
jgi:uncharacterized protein YgiM (DUF1202 family)